MQGHLHEALTRQPPSAHPTRPTAPQQSNKPSQAPQSVATTTAAAVSASKRRAATYRYLLRLRDARHPWLTFAL